MQNGHGNATADGRNRYSTSIAKRSNRILLRSHELPPGVSFPSIVCNVHTRLRSRHIRYAPGRIASALRCATRVASPSIIRKSVGGRVGTQKPLWFGISNAYFDAVTAGDPYRSGLSLLYEDREMRDVMPVLWLSQWNRGDAATSVAQTGRHRGRLDIFRQYLPSSAGETEILGIWIIGGTRRRQHRGPLARKSDEARGISWILRWGHSGRTALVKLRRAKKTWKSKQLACHVADISIAISADKLRRASTHFGMPIALRSNWIIVRIKCSTKQMKQLRQISKEQHYWIVVRNY